MGTRLLGMMVGLGMGTLPVAVLQAIGAGMRLSRVFHAAVFALTV